MAKVHLHVMIDEDTDRKLRALAAHNAISIGAVVNMTLKRGLHATPEADLLGLTSEQRRRISDAMSAEPQF